MSIRQRLSIQIDEKRGWIEVQSYIVTISCKTPPVVAVRQYATFIGHSAFIYAFVSLICHHGHAPLPPRPMSYWLSKVGLRRSDFTW